MNKTKNKLINYLLDYVEQGTKYPQMVLEHIANTINAEVTKNSIGIYKVKKKKEDKVLYEGYFRNTLEYLVFHILNN